MPDLQWLIVGTGDIVRKRVAAAARDARGSRIAGFCGSSRARVDELADQFNATERYVDLDDALARTSADAVYIAGPVFRHSREAVAALEAGKHVLVEKPLALNAADATAIVEASQRRSDLVAGCAFYRRCSARYGHAKRVIESGTLGKIVFVRFTCVHWFNPEANDPKHWRVERAKSGGGPMADVGSHMFDVLIGLLGMPTRAAAHVKTIVHDYDAEDTAAALLTLPDGGEAIANFGWSSKVWSHEMEVTGTEARLTWSPFDTGKVTMTVGRNVETIDLPPAENVHLPLVQDFVDAVREHRAPACPLAEALKTNRLMDAVYASSAAGKDVAP